MEDLFTCPYLWGHGPDYMVPVQQCFVLEGYSAVCCHGNLISMHYLASGLPGGGVVGDG